MALRRCAAIVALLAAACGSSTPAASATPTPHKASAPPTHGPTPTQNPCVVSHQSPPGGDISADFVTAMAFAPDGRLFYAERAGTVRVWQDGASQVFATVPTVTTERGGSYSERGLLGLAISPTFTLDRFVYAFYSDTDYASQHVIRWYDCAGAAMNPTVIITLPSGGDCCHKGGRIAFGGDYKLYVTLGEEHAASSAQNTSDVRGKVLRYNADGTVPLDNPFGAGNPVWAFGLRNPFGIAFNPSSGALAVTNNGPSGDAGSPGTGYDTLYENLTAGGGYEWPLCYGYDHPLQASSCGGQHGPDWSSEQSTYVPTGATFVDNLGPAGYSGHLVFCSDDKGMAIVTPGSPHASVTSGPAQCKFDVKEGPDHALYFSDTGHIYRMA
jgi:glucose/arabinose dehydrogenase